MNFELGSPTTRRAALIWSAFTGRMGRAHANHGPYLVAGLEEPVEICEVGEAGRGRLRPPEDAAESGDQCATRVLAAGCGRSLSRFPKRLRRTAIPWPCPFAVDSSGGASAGPVARAPS